MWDYVSKDLRLVLIFRVYLLVRLLLWLRNKIVGVNMDLKMMKASVFSFDYLRIVPE
jgi:hypothetical protein